METYIDTFIPWVDAKCAQALAKGGAIVYTVQEGSGVTDDWILTHVVPNMVARGIQRQVCIVLGRAVLWRAFDAATNHAFPEAKLQYIQRAYADIGDRNTLNAGSNPVVVSIVVFSFYT